MARHAGDHAARFWALRQNAPEGYNPQLPSKLRISIRRGEIRLLTPFWTRWPRERRLAAAGRGRAQVVELSVSADDDQDIGRAGAEVSVFGGRRAHAFDGDAQQVGQLLRRVLLAGEVDDLGGRTGVLDTGIAGDHVGIREAQFHQVVGYRGGEARLSGAVLHFHQGLLIYQALVGEQSVHDGLDALGGEPEDGGAVGRGPRYGGRPQGEGVNAVLGDVRGQLGEAGDLEVVDIGLD